MSKQDRREVLEELGRVGAGQSAALVKILEDFEGERDFDGTKNLVEKLRAYVASEFSCEPTPGEAARFGQAAAKQMGMKGAARAVAVVVKAYTEEAIRRAAEAAKKPDTGSNDTDDDDGEPQPDPAPAPKKKQRRGDDAR